MCMHNKEEIAHHTDAIKDKKFYSSVAKIKVKQKKHQIVNSEIAKIIFIGVD